VSHSVNLKPRPRRGAFLCGADRRLEHHPPDVMEAWRTSKSVEASTVSPRRKKITAGLIYRSHVTVTDSVAAQTLSSAENHSGQCWSARKNKACGRANRGPHRVRR
jgi:hypothetical protein